jgi:hypothetical protein
VLIRKRNYQYVLFVIAVFIVQVTELVQFVINVQKFHRQHQCNWRFAQIHMLQTVAQHGGREGHYRAIQSNGCISETVRNRTHVHITFLLRMTDTMTSQNIDLLSCDTLHNANWLVFITEIKSVYSAVRTGSLNKAVWSSSSNGCCYIMSCFLSSGTNWLWKYNLFLHTVYGNILYL